MVGASWEEGCVLVTCTPARDFACSLWQKAAASLHGRRRPAVRKAISLFLGRTTQSGAAHVSHTAVVAVVHVVVDDLL